MSAITDVVLVEQPTDVVIVEADTDLAQDPTSTDVVIVNADVDNLLDGDTATDVIVLADIDVDVTPGVSVTEVIGTFEAGPRGPVGPAGPAGGTFVFEQGIPSASWVIVHGLGYFPAGIVVIDSAGSVVEGTPSYPDENTVQIDFLSPFGGTAYVS